MKGNNFAPAFSDLILVCGGLVFYSPEGVQWRGMVIGMAGRKGRRGGEMGGNLSSPFDII